MAEENSEKSKEISEKPEKKSDTNQIAAEKPTKKQASPKRKNKKSKTKKHSPQGLILTDFAACGRCSFFWAGYRVIVGDDGIETAVTTSDSGWMHLTWNQAMRQLTHKSYGVHLDADFYHYEGCCKECCRQFVYAESDEESEPASFRMQVNR